MVATLDLVITTDTCIAHLAGAMAKPVLILLPHLSDWRWMQEVEKTPWYPTVRLMRQSEPGDWTGVVECGIRALSEFHATLEKETVRGTNQEFRTSKRFPV
jgi:ADP-heptose:LPS heptosyltransferase